MCYKPYRPTMRLLRVTQRLENGNLLLQASHTFKTLLEQCADMIDSKAVQLAMKVFEIVDSDRSLLSMDPEVVEVKDCTLNVVPHVPR